MRKHSTTNSKHQRRAKANANLADLDEGFTKAKRKWNRSQTQVRGLVERILVDEDNDQALALIALIDLLTSERKQLVDREALACMAMNHAYTQTLAFGLTALSFRDEALRRIAG